MHLLLLLLLLFLCPFLDHIGPVENANNQCDQNCVQHQHHQVREKRAGQGLAHTSSILGVLTIGALKVIGAGAEAIRADTSVEALAKAFRHLCATDEYVSASFNFAPLGSPLHLQNALVASQILWETNLFCLKTCLRAPAREVARLVS